MSLLLGVDWISGLFADKHIVFRAVIGMAYPEAFRHRSLDPDIQEVYPVRETAVDLREISTYPTYDQMIHWDIDPLNGMVSPTPN